MPAAASTLTQYQRDLAESLSSCGAFASHDEALAAVAEAAAARKAGESIRHALLRLQLEAAVADIDAGNFREIGAGEVAPFIEELLRESDVRLEQEACATGFQAPRGAISG